MDRLRLLGIGGILFLVVLIVAGCGSGSSTTPTETEETVVEETTNQRAEGEAEEAALEAEEEAEAEAAPSRTISFHLTNYEGWEYEGELPFPEQQLELGKEISASPPGKAQLTIHVTQTPVPSEVFYDTNAGRPNGPELKIEPGYFAYPMSSAVQNAYDGPYEFTPCEGKEEPHYEPFQSEIRCQVSEELPEDEGISQQSGDEHQIEAMARAMRNVKPVYVLNFNQAFTRECNIFILPDGSLRKSEGFDGCDEQLTLKVH